MRANLLVTLALLVGVHALPPFHLSEPLGNEWNQTITSFNNSTWRTPFAITRNSLSGFSSGSMLSTNFLRLDPESFDAYAFFAGIGVSNFTYLQFMDFEGMESWNLTDKQVFSYLGSQDDQPVEQWEKSVEFFKRSGANVSQQLIHDFMHTLPANLPANEKFNPESSCAPAWPGVPKKVQTGSLNCGYNMAYYALQHLVPDMPEVNMALDHTEYGTFHAFNQTPFTEGDPDAKMAEVGYIYIPDECKKEGEYCQAHMHIHGCGQSAVFANDLEVRRTGLLEWAAKLNLIMIFPQNNDSVKFKFTPDTEPQDFPFCWSSQDSDDKHNAQMNTLRNMMYTLTLGSLPDAAMLGVKETSEAALNERIANKQTKEQIKEIRETVAFVDQFLEI